MSTASNNLDELRRDVERWQQELLPLQGRGFRTTLWFGIVQRCCASVEVPLASCARFVNKHAGDGSDAYLHAIAKGKPLDRFTMGENVRVIRELHHRVEQRLVLETPLHPQPLSAALDSIVKIRNDFQHPRIGAVIDLEERRSSRLFFCACACQGQNRW